MPGKKVTIATRGSRLALWQAERVKSQLLSHDSVAEVALLIIKTKGDKILDVPLAKVGGKGLFVKEIEEALIDGRAAVAVHSMKDVPAELAPGTTMASISKREDPSDALISAKGSSLASLRQGASVGTSSLRRACQLLAARPDLAIAPLRGNVPTRIRKLDEGNYDAIILASAGLIRLGYGDRITEKLDRSICLPAAGQGALGIQTRATDKDLIEVVRIVTGDGGDALRVRAERAFLARLGGGCQTPLAALAELDGDELVLEAIIGKPDGTTILRTTHRGPSSEPELLGTAVAEELLGRGGDVILAELDDLAASERF